MTDKMTEMVDKAKEGFGKITDSLFGPKPNNAEEETAQQGQEQQASPPDEGREEDPTAVATRFEDKRLEDDKKLKDDKKQEDATNKPT